MAAQPADQLSPPGLARCGAAAPGGTERRIWEAATLLALRDRLRAGDIWVEGSRQWRAVEDQLIPPALFAAMREAGPLPVAVPATAEEYLAERRALLDRRLAEVDAKAAADALEDVQIKGDELKITPLKAITPEEAEDLADRLYGMVPNARITGLLAEVDRWTGFSRAFTHLHTGLPADDPRVVLTAVLADATNLGLTRMADACSVASYRKLAWTAGWHLREDTYRQALAMLVNAQQRQPLAAAVRRRRRVQLGRPALPDRRAAARPSAPSTPTTGARRRRCSTRTSRPATRPTTPSRSRPPARPRTSSTGCSTTRPTSASPSTTPTAAGSATTCSRLAHLLGFRFAPRIPNLAERRLYAFGAAGDLAGARAVHRRAPRREADRGALGRRAAARGVGAHRRRSAPRSCSSASAPIRGRTGWRWHCARSAASSARCSRWTGWNSPQLRRQATAELNKGESRNALARAVCFHRLGRLRDRTAEAQQHRASGLALVTAAIALWNTVYLGRALDAAAPPRRIGPGRAARPPRPARLAAHQPHRRLSLGCRCQRSARTGSGRCGPHAHGAASAAAA